MKIEDSVAVITGASSSVGQALALQLASRNIHGLALVDHHKPAIQLAQTINRRAGDWICFDFHGDLADAEFRRRVYAETSERCGTVNICVLIPSSSRVLTLAQRVESDLICPVLWAREMITGIADTRRRKNCGPWQSPEPPQGVVIFVGPEVVSHQRGRRFCVTTKLKSATSSLAMEAEHNGVGCEVLSSASNVFDMYAKHTRGGGVFPRIRIQSNARPQALSEVICFMIENASARISIPGIVSRFAGDGERPVF